MTQVTISRNENTLIDAFALKAGVSLSQDQREEMARTIRRLVEQVRLADAAFQADDPFPAYLA